MQTYLEDLVNWAERLLPMSFPHIVIVHRKLPGEESELLTSLDAEIQDQINTDLLPLASMEMEDLRSGISSKYGILAENCGVVCMGWEYPICNLITSAVLAWALSNTIPTVNVRRTFSNEQYRKALYENLRYLNGESFSDNFHFESKESAVVTTWFERNNEQDEIKWTFYGPEAQSLQKFLKDEIGFKKSSAMEFGIKPRLVLDFAS